ncbi:ATP-binding protein [Pseudomonas mucidolens]|uniref:histidine kinase n=1 Tax=Pseudomonas mucidolens TaxID=46679 RepID=A0A1H2NAN1_9PSED|nr:ATP-binding protein [Pseudomonas mucidolens]SDV01886.1 two-component system, NarL family, capsular synthesis sensor histidine kinase RcsC [Pseudomonas mucidolens]SQH32413.1 putative two-component system sensor kinase [Pseudomonas mucidolens]
MKSTPLAARKLLHLFAIGLIIAVVSGSYIYLRSVFNEEVSLRRSHMNEAVFNAQDFFVSRQTLLKSLVLATVPDKHGAEPLASVNPDEEMNINLGNKEAHWSLWLTRRIMGYLRENKVNLLYVPHAAAPEVTRLFDVSPPSQPVPKVVLQRLTEMGSPVQSSVDEVWLTDNRVIDSPFYLFERLDNRQASSGWLGIEVEVPDLVEALRSDSAGDFILLDGQGQIIFTNAAHSPVLDSLHAFNTQSSFGFIGSGWFPDRLAIRKQLGYSGWQIVYVVDIRSLLPVLGWPLLGCALLCIAVSIGLHFLIVRIDRRLITPGENRIQALVESEAFSRATLQIAPVALCVIRRTDGVVVLENPLSKQWLGNNSERDKLCHDWIYRAFDERDLCNNDEIEMEDGRLLHLTFAPTRYKSEDVLICAFSDISARKHIEVTLEQARQLADRANEAKTLFLATMSHEIRTPLYGVLGTLELLARTSLNDQQSNYLKAIERSSGNLLQLICDVLDVSRIEAGQLQLELNTFSPLELIEEVVQGYCGAAHAKGLQLFSLIDSTVPEWLSGDVTRIRQILNNLLNNALKFTDNGKIVLRLKMDSRDDERVMLHWQVSDTGKGIPREAQAHLFEPFYQVESTTNVVAGTGLGLSICKRLMHLMNGTMRLVSEPGLGSSFTLHLPLVQVTEPERLGTFGELSPNVVYVVSQLRELAECYCAWLRRWGARAYMGVPRPGDAHDDAVLLELHPGSAQHLLAPGWTGARVVATGDMTVPLSTENAFWQADLNSLQDVHRSLHMAQGTRTDSQFAAVADTSEFKLNLRILVAEDNVINQLILRDQLIELGCSVTLASDGLEALGLWQAAKFDLVLTDVNMPNMNGYELATQLRGMKVTTPIIGATANAMRDESERCLNAGMNNCLIKPFTLHTLYNCLRHFERTVQ